MKTLWIKGLMALCLISSAQTRAQDNVDARRVFEVGYSADLFFDVDPSDARAATKVWIEHFIEKLGEDADSKTFLLEDVPTTVSRLQDKTLDLAVLLPEEYLRVSEQCDLEPLFVTGREGHIEYEYGLLARADGSVRQLADLEAGSIIIERSNKGSVPDMWLEELLHQRELAAGRQFFSGITQVGRVSRAVLPVLFGNADACLVNLESFAMMSELNPQLARELQTLEKSPGFSRTLVCLRPDMLERYGGLLRERQSSLQRDPQGQQLLSLFHVDELVPFKPAYLRGVEGLIRGEVSEAGTLAKGSGDVGRSDVFGDTGNRMDGENN